MKGMCEVASHPRGEVTGRIVRTHPNGTVYRERICPVCGRVQGVARVKAVAS